MTKSDDNKPKDDTHTAQGTSVVEWLAAAAGACVFIAMIGYMLFMSLSGEMDGAPVIKLSSSAVTRQNDIYLVTFQAENTGKQTASSLVVKATLFSGDNAVETSEATIDYLPSKSIGSGGFFFRHDPNTHRLELTPVSYLDP